MVHLIDKSSKIQDPETWDLEYMGYYCGAEGYDTCDGFLEEHSRVARSLNKACSPVMMNHIEEDIGFQSDIEIFEKL